MSLVGMQLADGWVVKEELQKDAAATGGYFSRSYIVEKSGARAFMKALDFMAALQAADPASVLQRLTETFNFEKDILEECRTRKLRRVVRQVGHGVITIQVAGQPQVVQYLIMELADVDLRHALGAMANSVRVRALHQVAVGLNQLHQIGIAHQDLKPSNVLLFGGQGARVGDLGCASRKGVVCHRDQLAVAGDMRYAPPELLYGLSSAEFLIKRLGCDVYLLGSLIVLMWTGVALTSDIMNRMPRNLHWMVWHGRYADVLPYLANAFEDVLSSFRECVPPHLQELETLVRDLCDPDPDRRYVARSGGALPLQRFISRLDFLAQRCSFLERRV